MTSHRGCVTSFTGPSSGAGPLAPADDRAVRTLPSDWRYRLELVPARRGTGPAPTLRRDEDGWELVSTTIDADGLTEQRIYRKPA